MQINELCPSIPALALSFNFLYRISELLELSLKGFTICFGTCLAFLLTMRSKVSWPQWSYVLFQTHIKSIPAFLF